jgi:hypothetical protein
MPSGASAFGKIDWTLGGSFPLAKSHGGSAMRLRCSFVMFRRLIVFVLHGVFSLSAEEYRLRAPWPQ